MGISGLLPLLKSIQRPSNLRSFKGQTIGVDGYGWLHRGATACAIQLALGQPTVKYVEFAMNRVRLLQHCGVVPYLVFDGDYLPSKAGTENDRLTRREEAKRLGSELLRHGKTAQAHQEMQKAVDVTPEMAGLFIQELKRANIQYVVAPFEADSQLAYLEKHKYIDAVISEDSDLLVFGVRVLLTKLDQYGECVMIRQDDFQSCREISMANWEHRTFRQMAILSGCDYLDNIPNLGLKTAHRLLRKNKTVERTLQAIRLEGKFKVPPTYMENFTRAELTFLHQWVFCPKSKSMVNLNPVERIQDLEKMTVFIGKSVEAELAAGVANGRLHPHTKKPLVLPTVGQLQSRLTPLKLQQENITTKKGVSITEFFKKRQPLAELDPNSFIMTPHQQDLARNASSRSWISPSAPNTSDFAGSVITSTAMRTDTSASIESVRFDLGTPTQGRNKRQRLCHEANDILKEVIDIKGAMTGTSKFFPSASSKAKHKQHIRGFSIYSDDSVDEVLNSLPEPTSQAQPKDHTEAEAIMPKTAGKKARNSMIDTGLVVDNDDSQLTLVDLSTPEVPMKFNLEDTESTFVEGMEEVRVPTEKTGLFDEFKRSEGSATSSRGARMQSTLKRQLTAVHSATASASNQSRNLSSTQAAVTNAESIELKNFRPTDPTFDSVLVPTSSPPAAIDRLAQLIKGQGSEDQIVPDSEDEDDETTRSPKVLDLKRFVFTASV